MKMFTLYIGTEHSLAGPILATQRDEALSALKGKLADEFGGYSMDKTQGGYRLVTGQLIEEGSVRVEVLADEAKSDVIRGIAKWIKQQFVQESVLLTSTSVDYSFI